MTLLSSGEEAFRVDGSYVWNLSLSNGMKTKWLAHVEPGGERSRRGLGELGNSLIHNFRITPPCGSGSRMDTSFGRFEEESARILQCNMKP